MPKSRFLKNWKKKNKLIFNQFWEFFPFKIVNFGTNFHSEFLGKYFHQLRFLDEKMDFDTLCSQLEPYYDDCFSGS